MTSTDNLLTVFRKKELPIEYVRGAIIWENYGWKVYRINNWIGDDYFKTEYGTFLFDDSKATKRTIKLKDKIIIELICYYDIDDMTNDIIQKEESKK